MKKKVIVITGPTASGKTSLSIHVAKHLNTSIINADKIQMMKYFDIGSAKIKENEKEGITHHLLDFININEEYTVFDFQKDVRNLIDEIKIPLLVGGSGFYLKSSLYDYDFTEEDTSLVVRKYDEVEIVKMYNKIKEEDPSYDLHLNNHQRIIRAYHLLKQGIKPSSKKNKNVSEYNVLMIYLDIPRDILKKRLIERLELMINEGFIDEVVKLKNLNANLNVIGYKEINSYLDNNFSLDKTKDLIIKNSMSYAKRQKTWFKNQTNAVFVDALDKELVKNTLTIINQFLKE